MSDLYIFRERDPEPEWTLLDRQHATWTALMDNALFLAPLEDPSTILELGAGTGAWAMQMATQFPDATVTAADIAPLPERQYPTNMCYQKADFTLDFPFKEASFDVVHIRTVLFHIPHPRAVLERMMQLTRPRGWLLVEELCYNFERSSGKGEMHIMAEAWRHRSDVEQGGDTEIGKKLVGYIHESGLFDDVTERIEIVTRGKPLEDPAKQHFGEVMRSRVSGAFLTLSRNLVAAGKDAPVVNLDNLWDFEDESALMWCHFVWARRKVWD